MAGVGIAVVVGAVVNGNTDRANDTGSREQGGEPPACILISLITVKVAEVRPGHGYS